MLPPEARRSEVAPEHRLPPLAPSWLRVAVSGTFSAAIFLVPGVLSVLAPVPLLIAYRRYGMGFGLAASAVGVASAPVLWSLSQMGASPDSAAGLAVQPLGFGWLAFGLFAAVPAAMLSASLSWARGAAGGLALGAALYVALLGVVLLAAAQGADGGAGGLVATWVDQALDVVVETWRERLAGDTSFLEAVSDLEVRRAWYLRWMVRLMPSLAVSLVIGALWINVVYLRWFVGGVSKDDDLTLWNLPMGVMYSFMGCTAVFVLQVGPLGALVPRMDPLLVAASNGLILLMTMYWLQGVAVTNYYFLRMRLGPIARMAGVGAQALLMVYPVTSILFGAMGLADAWFDLRRIGSEATVESGEEQ
jgi:hypothetical protein